MYLKALVLEGVRSYEKAVFEFSKSLNVIVGDNAVGKTTILEAIWLLITGRSFRTSHQKEMIREEKEIFSVEALFVKHGIEQRLKVQGGIKQKGYFHNSTKMSCLSGLLGLLQGVVMVPDDTSLVKGGPKGRRALLDLYLAQKEPLYVHHLTRFFRAMKQRNCLLRSGQTKGLFPWENEMALSAVYIAKRRSLAIEDLNHLANEYFKQFTDGKEELSLVYECVKDPFCEKSYLEQFQRLLKRELALGTTLTGPHKDDLKIFINGKEAKGFASEGQLRCAVTAIHLGQWEGMKQETGVSPLMLVDDFALNLDEIRKQRLLTVLEGLGQVFITTTHPLRQNLKTHIIFREKR